MSKERSKDRLPDEEPHVSTLKELMRDKPRRGRPRRMVARQSVYVALHPDQKIRLDHLATLLPTNLSRADLPDLAVSVLTARVEAISIIPVLKS